MTFINKLPLAERMRPKFLSEYIGQDHLVGDKGSFSRLLKSKNFSSCILWGPPGVGKTTLAKVIANELEVNFYQLSAVNSGVKEIRDLISISTGDNKSSLVFIDEIHRFNKSQQDSLLHAIEKGLIILIGATTENPSFALIRPLLSRCQVYLLNLLEPFDLEKIINRAFTQDEFLRSRKIILEEKELLIKASSGDARKLLNLLELIIESSNNETIIINNNVVRECLNARIFDYDKNGELHYDIISAFIKSIRGSDPDAAVYWLARMISGGEDPMFIARRLVISAAEDIGLADPNALLIANACFDIVSKIGLPEARIVLSETTIYLSSAVKSNSTYMAIDKAIMLVDKTGNLPVPLHLRNAPTKLMKTLGYGRGYKYSHDYTNHFVNQDFFPEALKERKIWEPQENIFEQKLSNRMNKLWKDKYSEESN